MSWLRWDDPEDDGDDVDTDPWGDDEPIECDICGQVQCICPGEIPDE